MRDKVIFFAFLEWFLLLISRDVGWVVWNVGWVVWDVEKSVGLFFEGGMLLRIEGVSLEEFWEWEVRVFGRHWKVSEPIY